MSLVAGGLDPSFFYSSPWIDRAAHLRRDDEAIADLRQSPEARYLLVRRGRNLVAGDDPPAARSLAYDELPAPLAADAVVFLGLEGDRAWFAAALGDDEEPALPRGARFVDLRRTGPLMEARDGGLLAYARAIVHWHDTHRHCGRCGGPTEVRNGGFLRHCTNDECRREHFPRTDPAIIVRVVHGDRILLGRQPSWPPRWYSVLAGFLEPGESLEEAVRREVFEEAGVAVSGIQYFGSQPWPFPASLMVGFTAVAEAATLDFAADELEDARWMSRAEIAAAVEAGELRLPTEISIARRLVDSWLLPT